MIYTVYCQIFDLQKAEFTKLIQVKLKKLVYITLTYSGLK